MTEDSPGLQSESNEDQRADEKSRIRHEFVGMLFALTIAQIAASLYGLWSIPYPGPRCWAPLAHLVLGALVVIASWVGWSRSKAPGARKPVEAVFGWPFAVLLLDVLLVVLYFFLVREVEIKSVLGIDYIAAPSARPEARWLMGVFFVYIVWDIVADVLADDHWRDSVSRQREGTHVRMVLPAFIVEKTFASVTCCILAIVAYYTMAKHVQGTPAVVLADLALIVLVFLFRAIKPLELTLRFSSRQDVATPGTIERLRRSPDAKRAGYLVIALVALWAMAHGFDSAIR